MIKLRHMIKRISSEIKYIGVDDVDLGAIPVRHYDGRSA